MSNVEETLFLFTGDASDAISDLEALDASVAQVDESITALAASADSLTGLEEGFTAASGGAAELGDAALSTSEYLDQFQATAASTAATMQALGYSEQEVAAELGNVGASAATASSGLDSTAASAQAASASLDTASASAGGASASFHLIAIAALAAGGATLVMGMQGEDALTRTQALTGASSQQMAEYSAAIDGYAQKYGKTVQDLSGGLYDVISVGYQGKDALDVLNAAAEAAAAGGTDLHTVTNGLTSIMQAFALKGGDAQHTMDMLLTGVRDGKAQFQDFSNAVGLVASTASSAGFSLSDAVSALSTLTIVFPNARRAGMDLNHLLTTVGINAQGVADNAAKMGLTFDLAKFSSMNLQDRLLYLQQITGGNQAELEKLTGGTAGYTAAQVLLRNNSQNLTRIMGDMKNATGATDSAFAEWSQSAGAHAASLKGSFSVAATAFVKLVAPFLDGTFEAAGAVFGGVASFMEQHGEASRVIVTGLAVAVTMMLIPAVIGLAEAWTAASVAFLAANWPLIALGVAVYAVAEAVSHWAEVQHVIGDFVSGLVGGLGDALGSFVSFQSSVYDVFNGLPSIATEALSQMTSGISDQFNGLIEDAFTWGSEMLSMFAQGLWMTVAAPFAPILNLIGNIADVLGFHSPPNDGPLATSDQWMPNFMHMLANGITSSQGTVTSAINSLTANMQLPFDDLVKNVNGDLDQVQQKAVASVEQTNQQMLQMQKDAAAAAQYQQANAAQQQALGGSTEADQAKAAAIAQLNKEYGQQKDMFTVYNLPGDANSLDAKNATEQYKEYLAARQATLDAYNSGYIKSADSAMAQYTYIQSSGYAELESQLQEDIDKQKALGSKGDQFRIKEEEEVLAKMQKADAGSWKTRERAYLDFLETQEAQTVTDYQKQSQQDDANNNANEGKDRAAQHRRAAQQAQANADAQQAQADAQDKRNRSNKQSLDQMNVDTKTGLDTVNSTIRSQMDEQVGVMQQYGANATKGFADGLTSNLELVRLAAIQLADTANTAVTSHLGIHSPSEVFRHHGADTVEGFRLGIMESADRVEEAWTRLLPSFAGGRSGALPAIAAPPSASIGAGAFGSGDMGHLMGQFFAQLRAELLRAPTLGSSVTPASLGSIAQTFGDIHLQGTSNMQVNTLYQMLTELAGTAVENGTRGAYAGLGI